jgi:hypothetical protein
MKVLVVDYSHEWPALYERERQLLAAAVPPATGIIEHIGSTSVRGLAAKPIVDILIGVHDFATIDSLIPSITALGYEYISKYEDVMPYRRFFKKHDSETATHHIHMVAAGTEFWNRHLLFRDYLRANPDVAADYAALKRELAEREWDHTNDYAAAKTTFIRGIEALAAERAASADAGRITSVEGLEALYGAPNERSILKEIDYVSDHYRAFIDRSPFVVVATAGPEGLDCSPRGDGPGFVRVADRKRLLMPDRRGNNRLDTLRNIVRDGRIALLFLIPGVGETLRVNGRAAVRVDPELCASFETEGKIPKSVVEITVETVYFQCQKALVRSRLWDPDARVERSELPSTGSILQALVGTGFDGEAYDRGYSEHLKETIY